MLTDAVFLGSLPVTDMRIRVTAHTCDDCFNMIYRVHRLKKQPNFLEELTMNCFKSKPSSHLMDVTMETVEGDDNRRDLHVFQPLFGGNTGGEMVIPCNHRL